MGETITNHTEAVAVELGFGRQVGTAALIVVLEVAAAAAVSYFKINIPS